MKLNPIELTNYITAEYRSFLTSIFSVDDPDYQEQIQNELTNLDLFHGPYVKAVLPFVKGESVRELTEKKILDRNFLRLGGIDFDRPLYSHQIESIEKIAAGRSVIVTTGTGSGKTESFLFPILNHIIKVKKKNKMPTVKALLLYPMNALVNDQMDRIREILRTYPSITFGRYIGDTEEKLSVSAREEAQITHPRNELLDRDEIRRNPPDILITNYSMLEYLLIRPKDNQIISPQAMKDWQFLVLDEAHTYTGTKGTEISYLLRRLKGFTGRDPQCILTSATLGDQKSVNEIIQFGKNLTFSEFAPEDVIFASRRELDRSNVLYRNRPSVYSWIQQNLNRLHIVQDVLLASPEFDLEQSPEENLYYFLLHDENIYDLYQLAGKTSRFSDILKGMHGFHESELISLIRLLCMAKTRQGDFLFDAKYHYFITSPSRAFITLGSRKEIRFGNHLLINDRKAFEIGRCRKCAHLYITGWISKDHILEADTSVSPSDSNQYSSQPGLRVFSLENYLDEEAAGESGNEEDENTGLSEFHLCTVCGAICAADEVPACEHGASEMISIYEIPKSANGARNTYIQCPHCGARNNNGVVQPFRVDQSTATSVLGNIYVTALGKQAVSEEETEDPDTELNFDLFSEEEPEEASSPENSADDASRQILAFSDSRQQASYFAVSMEKSHDRAVKEHMIFDLLQENGVLPVQSLASRMESIISREDLFEYPAQSEAWIGILQDLFFLDGVHSAENLGLYTFRYPLSEKAKRKLLDEKNLFRIRAMFGLSGDEFQTLVDFAVDYLRKRLVIDFTDAELTEEQRKRLTDYSIPQCYVTGKGQRSNGTERPDEKIVSMAPINSRGNNRITEYLKKVCRKTDPEELQKLAQTLFMLMKNLDCFAGSPDEKRLQLQLRNFQAVPASDVTWYQCSKCKRITVHNIHDLCPEQNCSGTLVPCDPAKLFQDEYYYRQYTSIPVERFRVKEHTAQLSSSQAKEYQNEFKEKKINLLSCSTTFEMGVDIGSLENVLMRNMPPSPANYVQRAGRAGRGKDSSALIVTYCLIRSHDFTYFMQPEVMVDGIITPPVFATENRKIIIRHLIASALGFFFRKYPEKYRESSFVFEEGMQSFLEYLKSHPADLGEFIDSCLLGSPSMMDLRNFGWVEYLLDKDSHLNVFIRNMKQQIRDYDDAIQNAKDENDFREADSLSKNKQWLINQSLISLLSSEAVIPKYGFPVDVVELKRNWRLPDQYNLTRDLRIAISEYAPSSEIIVDKKKITSRYINLPQATSLETKYYVQCSHCLATNISIVPFGHDSVCSSCHMPLKGQKIPMRYLVPALGFTAEARETAAVAKPKRGHAGEVRYIGNGIQDAEQFECGGKVRVRSIVQDELAVLNETSFYYCPRCGFTEALKRSGPAPSRKKFAHKSHTDSWGRICTCETGERVSLGHVFKTDVLLLRISGNYSADELITTGFALRLGIHKVLQVELNDLDTAVTGGKDSGLQILLFDNVPGGAGYVRRLLDRDVFRRVICAAYDAVNHECCDEETICPRCLQTYQNQNYHKRMKRKYAKHILSQLMEETPYAE